MARNNNAKYKSKLKLGSDERLVFMHHPKTAGTAIHNCLSALYQPHEICPERLSSIDQWPTHDLAKYKFFSAHASLEELSFIPRPCKIVTFLRNPLERSISLYQYWASFSQNFIDQYNPVGPRIARRLPIKEFFSKENFKQNYRLWNQYTSSLLPRAVWHDYNSGRIKSSDIILRSIEALDSLSYVGISEHLDSSFEKMTNILDIPNLYRGQMVNVTSGNHEQIPERYDPIAPLVMDNELLSVLTEANELDLEIYQHALRKFSSGTNLSRQYKCIVPGASSGHIRVGKTASWVAGTEGGFVLHGPYVWLAPGRYQVSVEWQCHDHEDDRDPTLDFGSLDVVACGGAHKFGKVTLSRATSAPGIQVTSLDFEVSEIFNDFEFRVATHPGVRTEIKTTVDILRL